MVMVIDHKADLAELIADNYGECRAERCLCLDRGWIGKRCPNWVPVEAKNWEELRKVFKEHNA